MKRLGGKCQIERRQLDRPLLERRTRRPVRCKSSASRRLATSARRCPARGRAGGILGRKTARCRCQDPESDFKNLATAGESRANRIHVINQRRWIGRPHDSEGAPVIGRGSSSRATLRRALVSRCPACVMLDRTLSAAVEEARLSFQNLLLRDVRSNQAARSTSGNCSCRPDFGGHSMENVLLRAWSGRSPRGPPRRARASRRLPDGLERQELALDRVAHLLLEFSLRRGEWLFVVGELAFWNRPGPVIFFGPERAARMDEQHFDGLLALRGREEVRRSVSARSQLGR